MAYERFYTHAGRPLTSKQKLYEAVKTILAQDGILTCNKGQILWIEARGQWVWGIDEKTYEVLLFNGRMTKRFDLQDPEVFEKVKTLLRETPM
jgi:hypothetical protein